MAASESAIPAPVAGAMRGELASVAERTVAEIIVEVPSYADAFQGDMGQVIRNAVELDVTLADIGGHADDASPVVVLLQPRDDDRGIESAGIGEDDESGRH